MVEIRARKIKSMAQVLRVSCSARVRPVWLILKKDFCQIISPGQVKGKTSQMSRRKPAITRSLRPALNRSSRAAMTSAAAIIKAVTRGRNSWLKATINESVRAAKVRVLGARSWMGELFLLKISWIMVLFNLLSYEFCFCDSENKWRCRLSR